MPSTFPSVLTTYINPQPTDKLNAPSHSGIEQNQNSGLGQVEAVIGLTTNVLGTIVGDLRNPLSNGGGHVQTPPTGGTGQISFIKGDLLIASSSSVLTKLAVGTDGQVVTADSAQATGIKWAGVATAINIQNQTFTYARASVMSASVYGINLSQAISVLTDGQGFQVKFPTTNTTSVLALSVNATGPSSVAARLKNVDGSNPIVGAIQASMIGEVVFDSVSSVFQLQNTYLPTYGTSSVLFLRQDATWAPAPSAISLIRSGAAYASILNANTSIQTFAHGLGKAPSFTRIKAITNQGVLAYWYSEGTFDGSTTNTLYVPNATNGAVSTGKPLLDGSNIVHILADSSQPSIVATITVDSTNLNLTWLSKPDIVSSVLVKWEAYA